MRRARGVVAAAVQIVCFIVQSAALPVSDRCRQADLANDPAVLRTCWRLLASERYGFARLEAAAFIVRDANGELSAVDWPASYEHDSARWIGPFPRGTVAIVHTHPNWMPEPSAVDIATAHRVRVPVYVLTRKRIAKTDGTEVVTVIDGDWKPRIGGHCAIESSNCHG